MPLPLLVESLRNDFLHPSNQYGVADVTEIPWYSHATRGEADSVAREGKP